jgi:intergrase/recombinase
MTDEELVKALRDFADDGYADLSIAAADRIEALTAERDEQIEWVKRLADMQIASEAKLAKAVELLRKLHHAVCGETGFAACVRLDSGLAYPWPALDEADEMTRATLATIKGEQP